MPYDPTTFEPRLDATRVGPALAACAAEEDARAALAAAKARGLEAIRQAFATLIAEADLALGPVDGSSDALDELRAVRDDALAMAEDGVAAVSGEITRRAAQMAEGW